MGEKGLSLGSREIDALKAAADAARTPDRDPTALLAGWSTDFINDTPDLANKWMEAYLNWRHVQEARAGGRPPETGGPPPGRPAQGR